MKVSVFGKSNHTVNRIIPALKKISDTDILLVTDNTIEPSSFDIEQISYKNFLHNNYVSDYIIISTHPNRHISLLNEYFNFSNNFLIEKPITIDPKQILDETFEKLYENKFIDECLMYTHHPLYSKFLDITKNSKVKKVEIEFTIPHINLDNFRYDSKIGGGPIFDLGIYPLSLCLEIISNEYTILSKESNVDKKYQLVLGNSIKIQDSFGLNVECRWKIGGDYNNIVSITTDNTVYKFPRIFSKPNDYNSHFIINKNGNEKIEYCGVHDQFFLMYKNYFNNKVNKDKNKENIIRRYKLINKIKS